MVQKCTYHRLQINKESYQHKCIYCNFILDEMQLMYIIWKRKHYMNNNIIATTYLDNPNLTNDDVIVS